MYSMRERRGVMRSHGLRCYWRGCREPQCRRANAKYKRRYRGSPLETVAAVKSIVDAHSPGEMARKAKLGPVTIWKIKTGGTRRIRQETKRRILAATKTQP